MKKILAIALAAAIFMAAPVAQAREAGGLAGGLVGCCFGVRTAAGSPLAGRTADRPRPDRKSVV